MATTQPNKYFKLLLLIILLIESINCTFVNFIPYQYCGISDNTAESVGFTFLVDTCITSIKVQDNIAKGNIKVTTSNDNILVELFDLNDNSCSGDIIKQWNFQNTTCVEDTENLLDIIHFSFGVIFNIASYVTPIISNEPIYNSSSIIFQNNQPSQQKCDNSNLIYSVTLTNPYSLIDNSTWLDSTFTFACSEDSNVPYTQECRDQNMFCHSKIMINQKCENGLSIFCT